MVPSDVLGRAVIHVVLLLLAAPFALSCGTRAEAYRSFDAGVTVDPSVERCNGLDDDLVAGVDDPFRDALGRYVTDAHCGGCNMQCAPRSVAELGVGCKVVDEVPRCVASACVAGFAPTREGRCVPLGERLCLACANDRDCGALLAARCASIGGESRCSVTCEAGCPSGYRCEASAGVCVPAGGSCSCDAGDDFALACPIETPERMAGAPVCVGRARCDNGVISACQAAAEVCDQDDNDCDGKVDEGYVDARGAYSVDPANCGQCGVSCVEETGTELELTCGGDPLAPRCALACPDARDGVQVGDALDGDLDVATGCECRVGGTDDASGPPLARGEVLDLNCDGADGMVVASFYVAPDGDDAWVGSPTRPLKHIAVAMQRAGASIGTPLARPHVYVAAGTYTETLELVDGVQVHGGYRRDFRALDPVAFVAEVRAPAGSTTPGGAALVGRDVGARATLIEGLTLRGLDASVTGAPTVGVYLLRARENLTLRGLTIRAGVPGEGSAGSDGPAGAGPSGPATAGDVPRAAFEGTDHQCTRGAVNVVRGGGAGANACGGASVSGGAGGQASCPMFSAFQGAGTRGLAAIGAGGAGGTGGQDSVGPIENGGGCSREVCCGLADFTVPSNFVGPRAGSNGGDGVVGSAGRGCVDPVGRFGEGGWSGPRGTAGGAGQPGAGGGGGGAGGGVRMNFVPTLCEFADGLGGGGGGGGAGGCGGIGGGAGESGGPSIALVVIASSAFVLEDCVLSPSSAGRGGPGGAGGDGGPGGIGGAGGAIPPESRVTPTLAGTYPGARGGSGGTGGAGGGGGGGCGGSSVGVWAIGAAPATVVSIRARNRFLLGAGGEGGAGGGGAQAASGGARGEALDVVAQP